jgi:hypothetical protein
MHNLGQNNMEHGMNNYAQEYGSTLQEASNYEGQYEGQYEGGYGNESPLQEILQAEAPQYEGAMYKGSSTYETPYQETYQSQESGPYQELYGQEQGYQETGLYGEMNVHGETGLLGEEEELAYTSELLGIQSHEEMDQFLGKLIRRVARGARGFIRSPIGRMLGNVLRGVAKTALPIAGKALGTFVGGPAGAMIGGQLGNMAGQALGLEVGEMSQQEAEFANARQFVRLASDMVSRAQQIPQNVPPSAAVRQAVQAAAQQWAPRLLSPQSLPLRPLPMRSGPRGIWVRRGSSITLYGV